MATATSTPPRMVGRAMLLTLGGIFLLAAIALLGYELALAMQAGSYRLLAGGELWYRLSPGSLNLTQAIVQRYILPALWDPVMVTLLRWPAWPILALAGVILAGLGSRRRG